MRFIQTLFCSIAAAYASVTTVPEAERTVKPEGSFVREIFGCENKSTKFSGVLKVKNVTLFLDSLFTFNLAWNWTLSKRRLMAGTDTGSSETSIYIYVSDYADGGKSSIVDCRTIVFNLASAVKNSQWTGWVQSNFNIMPCPSATYRVRLTTSSNNEADDLVEDGDEHTLIVKNGSGSRHVVAVAQSFTCNGSDLFLAAAFPDQVKKLQLGIDGNTSQRTTALSVPFNATFQGLTPGDYTLFVAPISEGEDCFCGRDESDGLCYECGNFAYRRYQIHGSRNLEPWNGTMNVTVERTSERGCYFVQVYFCPSAVEHGFTSYNISVFSDNSYKTDYRSFVRSECDEERFGFKVCNLSSDNVTVQATMVGGRPRDELSVSRQAAFIVPMGGDQPRALSTIHRSNSLELAGADISVIGAVIPSILASFIIFGLAVYCKRRMECTPIHGKTFSVQQGNKLEADNGSLRFPEIPTKREGMDFLFGGDLPEVLLLYSCDHNLHVKIVSSLAEILSTFGGCKVIFDKLCDPETVQMNDWLHKRVSSADKVVIIASEGASLLYTANMASKFYPRYDLNYVCSNHVTDALSLASKCPSIRLKMRFVQFAYCQGNCLPALGDFAELQSYRFPEDMPSLVGTLHGAASPYMWSCKQDFETSLQLQEACKLIQKMQQKASHRPSYLVDTFGPAEDRFDSGIEHSAMLGCWEGSAGMTEVYTIVSPVTPVIWRPAPDKPSSPERAKESVTTDGLRTDMPRTEEIWNAYIEPDCSVAGSLTSEQLGIALRRLNSDSSDECTRALPESHYDFEQRGAELHSYETASTYVF